MSFSTVGVRWVTGLISAALGFAIGGGAAYLTGGVNAVSIIGVAIGALIFFTFILFASIISSYTTTAYHTCLYISAVDVEKAQIADQPIQVDAPAPLAAVLA